MRSGIGDSSKRVSAPYLESDRRADSSDRFGHGFRPARNLSATPDGIVALIDNRMRVVLPPEYNSPWLASDATGRTDDAAYGPMPEDLMAAEDIQCRSAVRTHTT